MSRGTAPIELEDRWLSLHGAASPWAEATGMDTFPDQPGTIPRPFPVCRNGWRLSDIDWASCLPGRLDVVCSQSEVDASHVR
jgi:hypothetical protein